MSKPQAPPSPNYSAAATSQGAANVDAAKTTNIMSNPNIISPYGSQTVSWGNPSSGVAGAGSSGGSLSPQDINFQYLDPAGQYKTQTLNLSPDQLHGQAPASLQAILGNGNTHIQAMLNGKPYNMGAVNPAEGGNLWQNGNGKPDSLYNLVFGSGGTPTPGAEQLDSSGKPILQPTVTQTLNPVSQAALNQQQQTELGLSTLANQQTGAISNLLNTPFSFGGTPQSAVGQSTNPAANGIATPLSPDYFQQQSGAGAQYATPAGTPNLFSFGSASGGVGAPNLATTLNTNGVAAMPVNAGTTGQQAIESRLAPQQARDLTSYQTQLINQGLRPGDEAYNNGMKVFQQGQNDAQTQAALYGLNLDMNANQQGFNEAVQSGQFGNQAQLASFGAGLQNQQAGNSAIAQNQQTALTQQQAYNQALAQGFSQAQAMQAAQNAASQQNLGNYNTQNQLQNQSQQQLYNEQLQSGQFANTAQNQALAQALQVRNAPINQITALLSGGQVQTPQFQSYQGANVAPAPVFQGAQAQGQYDQQVYAQQVAQHNALLGGLTGLATAPFSMFSFGNKPPSQTQSFGY